MTGRGQAAARVRGESRGRVHHQEGGGWPLSGHGHAGASGPGPDVLPLVKCPSALAEGRLGPSATGRVQLEPNLGIPPVFEVAPQSAVGSRVPTCPPRLVHCSDALVFLLTRRLRHPRPARSSLCSRRCRHTDTT